MYMMLYSFLWNKPNLNETKVARNIVADQISDDWAECGLFAQQQILRDSNWGKLGGIREIQATIARGLECRQKPGRATDEMAAQITPGRLTQHPN